MSDQVLPQETELAQSAPLSATGPYSRSEQAVIAEIRKAKRSGHVCAFTLTVDRSGVTIRPHGVPIRIFD